MEIHILAAEAKQASISLAAVDSQIKNNALKQGAELVEVISVILQVTYFKKTGGKRLFKMAPIHHHFELCGWSETRVVAVFSIVTAILCLIALMGV